VSVVPVDRANPLPLWAQLRDDLRRRLDDGEFAARFPTDLELVEEYDVSRHTVREAVRRLHDEGLLDRSRGKGTFVRAQRIEQPLGALYSLFRSVEDQGFEQRSVVRHLEGRTDAEAAGILGLRPKAPLVYLERVRLADGRAIALDCSWLPAAIARPLLAVDFTHTALYAELGRRCGVSPTSGWERIQPQLPTAEQRELLGLAARQAVFAIERVAFADDRPLEWRHTVVRGDLYSFVARWNRQEVATSMEPAETVALT
jgi:GntR family transcriptional regulator